MIRIIVIVFYLLVVIPNVVGGVLVVNDYWKSWSSGLTDSYGALEFCMFWSLGLICFVLCFKIVEFLCERVVNPICGP